MIFRQSKKNIVFCTVVIFIVVAGLVFFKATSSQAQFSTGLPFGGRVLSSIYCPCSQNFLLTVSGPVGGNFMYDPLTAPQLYQSFNLGFQTGMWALGLYTPGGHGCWFFNPGSGCHQQGIYTGTITSTVGTSPAF